MRVRSGTTLLTSPSPPASTPARRSSLTYVLTAVHLSMTANSTDCHGGDG
jgi:hypothetical protein